MRHYPVKLSLRLTTEEYETLRQAVATLRDSWRGISSHARNAIVAWAKAELHRAGQKVGRR